VNDTAELIRDLSHTEEIYHFPPTPLELLSRIMEAADEDTPQDELDQRFMEELAHRNPQTFRKLIQEWRELGGTEPPKKPLSPAEKRARRLEQEARRVRLAEQVDAAAEKRAFARLSATATQHDLWEMNHKFGKKGSTKIIWDIFTESELAKEGIFRG
jgi:hypothetical protein